uniref:FABP domain-containing protein n=1 Tax=Mesocestoides corti TaxID=53468 RepID=A0A5K3G5R8_MESCO
MEQFVGRWELKKTDGFDKIMHQLGVNAVMAKLGNTLKPDFVITDLGDGLYEMKVDSIHSKGKFQFKLNEECDEVTPDGRHVRSTVTVNGNTMKHVQVGEKIFEVERVVDGDTLSVTAKVDDIICHREYRRK